MALNPELLSVLRHLYGEVEVVSPGEWGDWEVVEKPRADGRMARFYQVRQNGRRGEQYALNCPFCSDRRRRMRVSHMFGRRDKQTGWAIRAGVHCFNEDCHKTWVYVQELLEDVQTRIRQTAEVSLEGRDGDDVSLPAVVEQCRPGVCITLEELAERMPRHPALEHLAGRGFDLEYLSEYYGVMVILKGHRWAMFNNRIYIPFWRGRHLVAWTARAVEPEAERKYLNSSGNLGGLLYGLRSAIAQEVLVAVEGPMDRWGVGESSFAVLSKSFGHAKQFRLKEAMLSHERRCKLAISLFDPQQSEDERARGKEHQLSQMARLLRECTGLESIPIALPAWLDAGGADGRFLADYLERQLKYVGHKRLGAVLSRSVCRSSATLQRV